jgi:hypothetical protein
MVSTCSRHGMPSSRASPAARARVEASGQKLRLLVEQIVARDEG